MKITKTILILGIAIQLWLINILFLLNSDPLYLRSILLLVFLLVCPGILFMLSWSIKKISLSEFLVYSVGLSIVFLMLVGLATNTAFYYFNFSEPLSLIQLLIGIDLAVILLLIIALIQSNKSDVTLHEIRFRLIDWMFFIIPPLFPIFSVIGALTLNNNGPNIYTMITLVGIAIYVFVVVFYRKFINRSLHPWILFNIALALLLMTSMRGWFVTGHDNQLEYFVFQLTNQNLHWNIADYRDPYNASLSITILPSVFASLLPVSAVYIYKIIFQVIFALIAVSAYLFFRKFSNSITAFLAVFVFVSFPSFISDMPMLNRQEVALFLFSLILLVLYSRALNRLTQWVLFITFGVGMVLAHYSTTYVSVALFAVGYGLVLFINKDIKGISSRFGLERIKPRLSIWMVVILIGFTYLWNVEVTNTAGGVQRVAGRTLQNIDQVFSGELRSDNALYLLFNWNNEDNTDDLEGYISNTIDDIREGRDQSHFYPVEVYEKYQLSEVSKERGLLTSVGAKLAEQGIDVFTLNFVSRQVIAKTIQILIVIGLVVLIRKRSKINAEYISYIAAAIFWIGLFLILPLLSVEYGAQRLFQQMLLVLGLPIVIGLKWVSTLLLKKQSLYTSTWILIFFFLSLSGFIPQITGGYYPQLHLNNSGIEYSAYHTHLTEVDSARWLNNRYSSEYDVYSGDLTRSRLAAVSGVFSYHTILPAVIRQDAYVYIDKSTIINSVTTADYNGDLFRYSYPLTFLDENKDLIYSNGGSRIYK